MSASTPSRPDIAVRRVYDPPETQDGVRVLIDRLWPRGLRKEDAHLDDWLKVLTPSTELRRAWHAGDLPEEVFHDRYRAELDTREAHETRESLLERAGTGRITLLTAVHDPAHSHVPVLLDFLRERA